MVIIEKNINPQKTNACIKPGQNLWEMTFFCKTNSKNTLFNLIVRLLNSNVPVPLDTIINLLYNS